MITYNKQREAVTEAKKKCVTSYYEGAQAAWNKIEEQRFVDEATAARTARDYTAARKDAMNPAGTGEAGTLCARKYDAEKGELLAREADACKPGLCCGSANKYLRDGTRLTVETCQKPTDTTYEFFPAL